MIHEEWKTSPSNADCFQGAGILGSSPSQLYKLHLGLRQVNHNHLLVKRREEFAFLIDDSHFSRQANWEQLRGEHIQANPGIFNSSQQNKIKLHQASSICSSFRHIQMYHCNFLTNPSPGQCGEHISSSAPQVSQNMRTFVLVEISGWP